MTTKVPAGARPPMDRKVTRKSEEKRDEALDQGLKLTIDGEAFEARIGDVTPTIARELRAATGMSFMRLMETCYEDPDVDVISSFVWLARRIRGEVVDHDSVVVGYGVILGDAFEVEVVTSEELDPEDPEA